MNPQEAFFYGLYALIALVALVAVSEAWKRVSVSLADRRAVAKAKADGRVMVIRARTARNQGKLATATVAEIRKLMATHGLTADAFSVGDDMVTSAELERLAGTPAVTPKAPTSWVARKPMLTVQLDEGVESDSHKWLVPTSADIATP